MQITFTDEGLFAVMQTAEGCCQQNAIAIRTLQGDMRNCPVVGMRDLPPAI